MDFDTHFELTVSQSVIGSDSVFQSVWVVSDYVVNN